MVYDLKYHLTTIVAIFLALAVGIMVGSSFIAGSSVRGLEDEFSKLRAENQEQRQIQEYLCDQIKKHTEFDRAAAPVLVGNQLWGRNIAIIQTGDYSEATQSAKAIIEQAGGQVVSVTTIHNLRSETSNRRMLRAMEAISGGSSNEGDPIGSVLSTVADCIVNGSNPRAMKTLESNYLLSAAGKYDKRVIHVVLVGGSKSTVPKASTAVDITLIDKLKAAGASTIIGTEPLEVNTSFISAYHLKQIPTVDNVDQYIGQIGLVYAINGESGHFGVKKTSDRVAPEFYKSSMFGDRKRR